MVRNHSRRVFRWCAVGLGSLALTAEIAAAASAACIAESDRVRARQLGIAPGVLAPGPLNAITDVDGVLVGQTTLSAGDGSIMVEEAIYNSLLMATTTRSRNVVTGKEVVVERLPLAPFLKSRKLSCH